ncbi:MAG TPA: DUF4190 domain-containing protein [Acidimicrobiales bacterium]
MTNLPIPSAPLLPRHPAYQVPDGQRKTNGMAVASLVFSIVWIGGIGSIVAIILGLISQRKVKRTTGANDANKFAISGLIIGVGGLVVAVFFWAAVLAGSNGVNTSSPSYVDGNNYAIANYSNATAEAVLCASSSVPFRDNPSFWMRGCLDGWATARFAINNSPGLPGLNVG